MRLDSRSESEWISLFKENFHYDGERLLYKKNVSRFGQMGTPAARITVHGYKEVICRKTLFKEHRVIFAMINDRFPSEIDHINNIKTDNRIENLRECTRQENMSNIRTKRHLGVTLDENKWLVRIVVRKKKHTFGPFTDMFEAYCKMFSTRNELGV